jgi:hypothetical protein
MGANPVKRVEVAPKVDELARALADIYADIDFECITLEFWTEDEDGTWPPKLILVKPKYRANALVLTDEDKEVLDAFALEIHGWDDIALNVLGAAAKGMEIPIEKIVKVVIEVYEKE